MPAQSAHGIMPAYVAGRVPTGDAGFVPAAAYPVAGATSAVQRANSDHGEIVRMRGAASQNLARAQCETDRRRQSCTCTCANAVSMRVFFAPATRRVN